MTNYTNERQALTRQRAKLDSIEHVSRDYIALKVSGDFSLALTDDEIFVPIEA